MTEENYEEQAAEAEAALQSGVQQAPLKQDGEPGAEEELEDTFHVNLDYD